MSRELACEIADDLLARGRRGEITKIGIDEISAAIAAHPQQSLIATFWGDFKLEVCQQVVRRAGGD